jgi:hypothetical protein
MSARSPRRGIEAGKARIEFDARHQHTEAIGSDEAQSRGTGIFRAELRERTEAVTHARRQDDRGSAAALTHSGDKGWNSRRRRRDHDQIGHARQRVEGFDGANALDGVVMRIDEADLAGKTAAAQVLQHGPARRLFAWAGADHGDGSWREQLVETVGRHCPILSPCFGFLPDNKPGEKSIAGYRRDDLIAPTSQECIGTEGLPPSQRTLQRAKADQKRSRAKKHRSGNRSDLKRFPLPILDRDVPTM